jgi:branched-chain amino acid transport system ATP-binding protein
MLDVRGISVAYGTVTALESISLQVSQGELVSIIGANGAGKTTLMRALIGLIPIRSGECFLSEIDITRLETSKRVSLGMALVPEGRKVFPRLTVFENLQLGSYVIHDKHKRNEMYDRVTSLFPVLLERSSQIAGTLSGGEQQMLAIGRALMSNPKLLLLDEPSMGVAPIIVDAIFETLLLLSKAGLTILLVEQNIERALDLSSRAYVIELGKLVFNGCSKQVKADSRIIESYLGL